MTPLPPELEKIAREWTRQLFGDLTEPLPSNFSTIEHKAEYCFGRALLSALEQSKKGQLAAAKCAAITIQNQLRRTGEMVPTAEWDRVNGNIVKIILTELNGVAALEQSEDKKEIVCHAVATITVYDAQSADKNLNDPEAGDCFWREFHALAKVVRRLGKTEATEAGHAQGQMESNK